MGHDCNFHVHFDNYLPVFDGVKRQLPEKHI